MQVITYFIAIAGGACMAYGVYDISSLLLAAAVVLLAVFPEKEGEI